MADDKPVGLAVYLRNNRLKTNHIAEIYSFYVRREFQGQGIGKKLIDAAITEIKGIKGVTKIMLTVNPTQQAAEHLYHKYGFQEAGRLKNQTYVNGKFYDEIIMEKFV
jgi:ribosomal protein S18 acetylase RimI-like enzyme